LSAQVDAPDPSTTPLLTVLGIPLILAWKNAGCVGLDGFLLPALGKAWSQPEPKQASLPAHEPAVATTH
jgi:hypothetical protein